MDSETFAKHTIPRDAVAARVVYHTGSDYRFRHKSDEKLSTTPLRTRPLPQKMEDFTGLKKGYLTVIGLYGGVEVGKRPLSPSGHSKTGGHGWVCRCSCGNYTTRKTSSLKKNRFDACIECRATIQARNKEKRLENRPKKYDLKDYSSLICRECALNEGGKPSNSIHTVHINTCKFCGQKKHVSSLRHWQFLNSGEKE
jgi:hypothetical protein